MYNQSAWLRVLLKIIMITVLHSRSLLAVVGGYFFPLKIS